MQPDEDADGRAGGLGHGQAVPRVLGDLAGDEPGPLLIFTAGIHGNEPAGVEALRRVFAELERHRVALRGRVVALSGNTAALARRQRFVDEDLNRLWTVERMQHRRTAEPAAQSSELAEQRDLAAHIETLLAENAGDVALIDLHSTSGAGPAFAILADLPGQRRLASDLGLPAIFGLHKNVPGTLIDWFERLGHVALVVEGGQNDAGETRERHVAVIWLALEACGLLEPGRVDLEPFRRTMAQSLGDLPQEVDVTLRWGIEPGERFRMEPGFVNMQHVARGQLLAHGGRFGEIAIRAPFDAVLLMPLYQAQGSDGFFLALPPEQSLRARRSATRSA